MTASHVFFLIVSGISALLGLFAAASATDDALYLFGLALFLFGTVFGLGLIKQSWDATDRGD